MLSFAFLFVTGGGINLVRSWGRVQLDQRSSSQALGEGGWRGGASWREKDSILESILRGGASTAVRCCGCGQGCRRRTRVCVRVFPGLPPEAATAEGPAGTPVPSPAWAGGSVLVAVAACWGSMRELDSWLLLSRLSLSRLSSSNSSSKSWVPRL